MIRILYFIPSTLYFILLLSSCSFEPITVSELKSAEFSEMDAKGIRSNLVVNINNPNKRSLKVRGACLDGYLNKKSIGKVTLNDKFVIKKCSQQDYTISVTATPDNIIELLPSILSQRKSVLQMKGYLKVRYGILPMKVKFEMEDDFIPRMTR